MKKFLLIFCIVILKSQFLFSQSQSFDIEGNWSAISSDSLYSEFLFRNDTVEIFDKISELYPVHITYKTIEGELFLYYSDTTFESYKITILDTDKIKIENSRENYKLKRVDSSEYNLGNIIDSKCFYRHWDDSIRIKELIRYVDSNFTIRETKFRIEENLLDKKKILEYWKSQLEDSSTHDSYYEFLIREIE
ncbi:hypothetical protein ACFLSE_01805 [Bacteroidota bacterium]